jgi:hypothetical protein
MSSDYPSRNSIVVDKPAKSLTFLTEQRIIKLKNEA